MKPIQDMSMLGARTGVSTSAAVVTGAKSPISTATTTSTGTEIMFLMIEIPADLRKARPVRTMPRGWEAGMLPAALCP